MHYVDKLTSKKYAKTINLLCAGNKLFVKYQAEGGSETHSSLRQSHLPLQNDAALMSFRIRVVEHRKCVAGPAGAHTGLQDRILQNYARIENAHEVRKKTFIFYYV